MQEDAMISMSSSPGIPYLITAVLAFASVASILLLIASMWKIFTKAGKPGWASLIPIYNTLVMLEIAERPAWWVLLFFLPVVNIIATIVLCFALAEAFNKSSSFGLGLLLLGFIFFPLLAFGDAEYQGRSPAYA